MPRFLGTPSVALLLCALTLPGCDADEETGDAAADTLEVAEEASDTAMMCECTDGICPEGRCDVRVVVAEDCRAFLDTATVIVDGETLGEATVETPFVSCRTWACDEVLEIEVRSTAISTGKRQLAVSLDPDVPLSCEGL